MTNITEQRKVVFLRWPFFAHAAQEELYRLIFTSKEREAHQLPARYFGPRKPCSKASFALPVSLAEEKQALNAFDILSSFVRPIRSDAPHNVEMMAISEVASSAHSENDMDGDDFPQWTFKIDDDSPAPLTDYPLISSLNPVSLSTATEVPSTADLSVRLGLYQVYEAEKRATRTCDMPLEMKWTESAV